MPSEVRFFSVNELETGRRKTDSRYLEFLRMPALSAGLYVLAAGSTDPQKPHAEDEMYYVVRGRASFEAANERGEINAGSVIFVAKGVQHRFYDITEDLTVLVFFAPAES